MKWVDRVNGNGVAFRQWQATAPGETMPEWGWGETYDYCLVCGERYASRYMDANRVWHEGSSMYIYHDPERHKDYQRLASSVEELQSPREPGET